MNPFVSNYFATLYAVRDLRPFSYWPSKQPGLAYVPLPPAAYTNPSLGGHSA